MNKLNVKIHFCLLLLMACSLSIAAQALVKTTLHDNGYIEKNLQEKDILINALFDATDKSFHLFTHGRPGELLIEGEWKNKQAIVQWMRQNHILMDITHLNIYGCNFAQDEKGLAAFEYLKSTLGISVAASDDITGRDGDWDLEVGGIINSTSIEGYQYNLQTALKRSTLSDAFAMDEGNNRLYVIDTVITNSLDLLHEEDQKNTALNEVANPRMEKQAKATLASSNAILRFEQNIGQMDNSIVLFKADDTQATHYFTKNEVRSIIAKKEENLHLGYGMQFINANENVEIYGIGETAKKRGIQNYITNKGTFSDVPMHNQLTYQNLWEGVTAKFYENDGSMKYDYIVEPNADAAQVRFKFDGAKDLKVNAKGELEFTTAFGTLQKGTPYTYQIINTKKVEVPCSYVLKEGEVSFKLGSYDHNLPLIIDPIALKFATFLGGNNLDIPYDIFVTDDYIYLTGYTQGGNFPITTGVTATGFNDVFVTCLEKNGSAIVWSTVFGGGFQSSGQGINVDANGDVYVTGWTNSDEFPVNGTVAAYDNVNSSPLEASFLVRLDPTGTILKYSTYYNWGGDDNPYRKLVVDNGIAYFIAQGFSSNIPARIVGIDTNIGGAAGLVAEMILPNGQRANYSEIEQDKDGNLWVVGFTIPDNGFQPTANAVQSTPVVATSNTIPVVIKFSLSGDVLYSSYVLPIYTPNHTFTRSGQAPSLDIDEEGNVYVGAGIYDTQGATNAIIDPAVQQLNELSPLSSLGNNNVLSYMFVAKIPYDLSPKFEFVSILPASRINDNNDPEIAIDKKGKIHVLINVIHERDHTPYYPYTQGAIGTAGYIVQPTSIVNPTNKTPNYFVLNPSGSSVLYGTSVGTTNASGNDSKSIHGLYVDDDCNTYLNIFAYSENGFISTPSYRDQASNTQVSVAQPNHGGGAWDANLAVFHDVIPNDNTIPDFSSGNNTFCVGGAIWQNPNDGPIIGSTANFTSGDGSSAAHNLPDILMNGGTTPHPTPGSPQLQYQWQKSVNSGPWTNVGNGTYDAYKPEPELASGSVEYRRLIINSCGDIASTSNVAAATIAGTFNMQITTPATPVYYCPSVSGTSLDVSITGASGNISWQWYDGYALITGTDIISPSSGAGIAQGSFTAEVGTGVTGGGFYRLVVTDAAGCKKEAFVSIAPKIADAGVGPIKALCPGTTASVTLGPAAINPDFDYSWIGPAGFTSTEANPTVSATGIYTLQVKLTTDATFCSPGTTIEVTPTVNHDPILSAIPDSGFCQANDPAPIGLSGSAPTGYVFQWSPGINLDNQQTFSPNFDPGVVPNGASIGNITYTFSALRLSDGCIFETTTMVSDTALGLANAGADQSLCGGTEVYVGAVETTGGYYEWRAVETDYSGGLAAFQVADQIDGNTADVGINKFAQLTVPAATAACYYILYELKASYVPFPTNCFTRDTVQVLVCPMGDCNPCPDVTATLLGTEGACSDAKNVLTATQFDGLQIEWTTLSVDGVTQAANTPPNGLFVVVGDDTQGTAIAAVGPHPNRVIVNFDEPTWGWTGANVVVYQVRAFGVLNGEDIDCSRQMQVFSGINGTPVIGVNDLSICSIPSPGVRVGTAGNAGPYTISGSDYTQAPNSAFIWDWSNLAGGVTGIIANGDTPFPTLDPEGTSNFLITATDPETGCITSDMLTVKVNPVVANASNDLNDICPGSLVQLGTVEIAGLSYSWSPTAGLNSPIGTLNSNVAQPYLAVPNSPAPPAALSYTVTVTDAESGCMASDEITINTSTTAPPAISPADYNACPDGSFIIGPAGFLAGVTYDWTVVSGSGASLSWLSSSSVRQPLVSLPAGFSGAVFRLTMTKGTCGSVSADYTLNDNDPNYIIPASATSVCTTPYTRIGITGTRTSGYNYEWTPHDGLYQDPNGTSPYTGQTFFTNLFVKTNESTTYTFKATSQTTGCIYTDQITVAPPVGTSINAGADKVYCPDGSTVTIGMSGTGTLSWSAIGYDSNPQAIVTPSSIAAPMTSALMLGYIGGSANSATRNFGTGTPPAGKYVYRVSATSGGCTVEDDVVVTVPNKLSGIAGSAQAVCMGEAVLLGITNNAALIYSWTALSPSDAGSTISDPSVARPSVTPTVNTTYQVVYTDGATGCSYQEQVSVVINQKPNIEDVNVAAQCTPIVAIDLTTEIPSYGSYFNQIWYQNTVPGAVVGTPSSVTPTQTTEYFLIAENTEGCLDTVLVNVNVENPQTPNIIPSVTTNCPATSIDLADYQGSPSDPSYTLEWHTDNTTNPTTLITNTVISTGGTYYLFETTPNGCGSGSGNLVYNPESCCPVQQCGIYTITPNN